MGEKLDPMQCPLCDFKGGFQRGAFRHVDVLSGKSVPLAIEDEAERPHRSTSSPLVTAEKLPEGVVAKGGLDESELLDSSHETE